MGKVIIIACTVVCFVSSIMCAAVYKAITSDVDNVFRTLKRLNDVVEDLEYDYQTLKEEERSEKSN